MKETFLYVLWQNARKIEDRVLEDLRREFEVAAVLPQRWPGDPRTGYARFYGAKAQLAAAKADSCGCGEFLTVIVRDPKPEYGWAKTSRGMEYVNLKTFEKKRLYREWTGGGHSVHSTNSVAETRRDIFLLTGLPYEAWQDRAPERGVSIFPGGEGWTDEAQVRQALVATGLLVADEEGAFGFRVSNVFDAASVVNARRNASGEWIVTVAGRERVIRLELPKGFDSREARIERTFPADVRAVCTIDYAEDLRETFEADWTFSNRFWRDFPDLAYRPVSYRLDLNSEDYGLFARERIRGATLREALDGGLSESSAAVCAEDMLRIAEALERAGICHRQLSPETLIIGPDGHLRIRDFRFAVTLAPKREARWLERNWTVLADLGWWGRPGPWRWNDRYALAACLDELPDFAGKADVRRRLEEGMFRSERPVRFRFNFAVRMWLLGRWWTAPGRPAPGARLCRLMRELKRAVREAGYPLDRVVVTGSAPLDVFGLRRSGDLDFLLDGDVRRLSFSTDGISSDEDKLAWSPFGKDELIYDARRHFRFEGLKVITLETLRAMKERHVRNRKDREDILRIRAYRTSEWWGKWLDARYVLLAVREFLYRKEREDGLRTLRFLGFIRITYRRGGRRNERG